MKKIENRDEIKRQAYELNRDGFGYRFISSRLGVCKSTVGNLIAEYNEELEQKAELNSSKSIWSKLVNWFNK